MGNTLIKHYFPHDFNARNDDDIEAMLLDYRATGYGLYWGIVERLHEDENHVELNDRFYKAVAKQFMEDPDKVKTFIHDCVVKYFLFELNGDTLTCARVGRNIDKRSSISKERSEAGKAGAIAKKNKAIAEESEANAQQNLANPSKEKESKEKEIKENKSKVSTAGEPATIEQRCKIFFDRVFAFEGRYARSTLQEFYDYWTEKNEGGRRVRFEMQKVFDIQKRLVTWSKNEKKRYERTETTPRQFGPDAAIRSGKEFLDRPGFSRNYSDG